MMEWRNLTLLAFFVIGLLVVANPSQSDAQDSLSCNYFDSAIKGAVSLVADCEDNVRDVTARRVSSFSDRRDICRARPLIPAACVRESIRLNKANEPAPTYVCGSDSATTFRPERSPRPCASDTLVEYMANETNRALACINSDGDKLDPREVFEIINHESHFTPNVASAGGIGLMQLTSSAVNAFYTPEVKPIWDNLKRNSQCKAYVKDDDYLGEDGKNRVLKTGQHDSVMQCQFLNIKTNPSRSLVMGLSLYKAYRRKIVAKLKRDGVSLDGANDLVTRLTQVAYNRGLGTALRAYRKEKHIFLQDKTKVKLNALEAFDFNVRLDDLKTELEKRYAFTLTEDAQDVIDAIFGRLAFEHSQRASGDPVREEFVTRTEVISFFKKAQMSNSNPSEGAILKNILLVLNSNKIKDSNFLYADKITRDLKTVEGKNSCKFPN